MPSQPEIAVHLGLDQAAVSRTLRDMGIDWRASSMDDIRLAYIRRLRAAASGHASQDGQLDLVAEKAKTERIVREIKSIELEQLQGRLVAVEDLEHELTGMLAAFRAELLARDEKLAAEIEALYGVTVDRQLLQEHTYAALLELSRYDPSSPRHGEARAGGAAAADAPDDDGLGEAVPPAVPKKQRTTRKVQT